DAKDAVKSKFKQEENRQRKVADLMKQFNSSFHEAKYIEAERYAQLAHELDPNNAIVMTAVEMAKRQQNALAAKNLKEKRREEFLQVANDADDPGETGEAVKNGALAFNKQSWEDRVKGRKSYLQIDMRRSEKELEIERKLDAPVNLSFTQTPLYQI